MTNTDIGILFIILCVLLWAIMAAVHRHTVQLDALRGQVERFLKQSGSDRVKDPCTSGDEFAPRHPTE